jgi:hypothetical protein
MIFSPVWKPYEARANKWPGRMAFLTGTLRHFGFGAQSEKSSQAATTEARREHGID